MHEKQIRQFSLKTCLIGTNIFFLNVFSYWNWLHIVPSFILIFKIVYQNVSHLYKHSNKKSFSFFCFRKWWFIAPSTEWIREKPKTRRCQTHRTKNRSSNVGRNHRTKNRSAIVGLTHRTMNRSANVGLTHRTKNWSTNVGQNHRPENWSTNPSTSSSATASLRLSSKASAKWIRKQKKNLKRWFTSSTTGQSKVRVFCIEVLRLG